MPQPLLLQETWVEQLTEEIMVARPFVVDRTPASAEVLFTSPISMLVPAVDPDPSRADYWYGYLESGHMGLLKPASARNNPMADQASWAVLNGMCWTAYSTPSSYRVLAYPENTLPVAYTFMQWHPDLQTATFVQDYPEIDQARIAVYDYVTKQGDRHNGNFGTLNGSLFIFDHGVSFVHPIAPMVSNFAARWDRRKLPDVVVEEVRAACGVDWDGELQKLLRVDEIGRFLDRLKSVAAGGRILV